MLAAAGYAASGSRPDFLWVASLGLVINWFGDSLDGTVARLRRIERPRYGYYLDNSIDCLAQLLLAFGIGLSGYVRFDLCLLALVAYLMVSVLSFIRANVSDVFQITYAAVGPTEVRVGFVVLNALLIIFPPDTVNWGLPLTYPNLWSLAWSSSMLVTFLVTMFKQVRQLCHRGTGARTYARTVGTGPVARVRRWVAPRSPDCCGTRRARAPAPDIQSFRPLLIAAIRRRIPCFSQLNVPKVPLLSERAVFGGASAPYGSATSCANSDKAG